MPDEDAHTERTSLLSNHTIKVNISGGASRGHEATKGDGSTGSIGATRGISIVICLWLLIFLQGLLWINFTSNSNKVAC